MPFSFQSNSCTFPLAENSRQPMDFANINIDKKEYYPQTLQF